MKNDLLTIHDVQALCGLSHTATLQVVVFTFIMLLKHFESQETRVKITTAKVLRIKAHLSI